MTGFRLASMIAAWFFLSPNIYGDSLSSAYEDFDKGRYEQAADGFKKHLQERTQDYEQQYNTGVALYQKGDFQQAAEYFERAKQSAKPELKSQSAYNKGMSELAQGQLDKAVQEFGEALSYDNDNKVIRENLEWTRQKAAQKKQQNSEQKTSEQNQENNKAEQKQAEQKQAEQKQAEQKQGEQKQAEQKQAEQKQAGEKGKDKPEGTSLSEAQAQKGAMPGDEKKMGEGRELTVRDLEKQEAEKLLRTVDDRLGQYNLSPEQAERGGKSSNGKEW